MTIWSHIILAVIPDDRVFKALADSSRRFLLDLLFRRDGRTLTELESELEHHFGREDVSTVGGLVMAELGRVPRAGEQLRIGDYQVTVEQVARRRVRRVSVRHVPEAAVAEEKQ